jgi:hypothetical protein
LYYSLFHHYPENEYGKCSAPRPADPHAGKRNRTGENHAGKCQEAIDAIRADKPIPDAKLQALSAFTRVMVSSRGMPSPRDLAAFKEAGYTEHHVLEIILAIAVKTLSNYSNHIFDTETDERFAGHKWSPA